MTGGRTGRNVPGKGDPSVDPVIGVLSDTHGLLRPGAVDALRGVERIIHAGDVGDPAILDRLREVAPLEAVRGNVDRGGWAARLPETRVVEVAGRSLYVLHRLETLDLSPSGAGFDAVIYGHTHRPEVERREGVLYLNPGSVGPRRADRPVCLALLHLEGEGLRVERVDL